MCCRKTIAAARACFHQLLAALVAEFDGRIEGINLPETSIGIGVPRTPIPAGFSPAAYREGILANMAALKKAFPKSVAMQYANFMPGEWLPADDHGHLAAGSPDLLPSRPGQRNHPYPQLRRYARPPSGRLPPVPQTVLPDPGLTFYRRCHNLLRLLEEIAKRRQSQKSQE